MTLPHERYNAIKRTENFLKDLMDPKKTPRVPREIESKHTTVYVIIQATTI
jgi:hypothetical protein